MAQRYPEIELQTVIYGVGELTALATEKTIAGWLAHDVLPELRKSSSPIRGA